MCVQRCSDRLHRNYNCIKLNKKLVKAFAALKQNGLALLMGEQNVPFTARVADRYLILSHGHVTAEGGREDLASPEKLADAFMGLADDTTKTGGGFT